MSLPQMIRITGLLGVLFFLTVLFAVLAYLAGPQIEARAFPIIKALSVAGTIQRDARCICWSTQFRKLRHGTPVVFNYHVVHDGRSIPVAAYRAGVSPRVYLSTYGFGVHGAGESWVSRYCLDLPRDLPPADPFTVEGEAVYEVWHRLWRVVQPLPSFKVLPLT